MAHLEQEVREQKARARKEKAPYALPWTEDEPKSRKKDPFDNEDKTLGELFRERIAAKEEEYATCALDTSIDTTAIEKSINKAIDNVQEMLKAAEPLLILEAKAGKLTDEALAVATLYDAGLINITFR